MEQPERKYRRRPQTIIAEPLSEQNQEEFPVQENPPFASVQSFQPQPVLDISHAEEPEKPINKRGRKKKKRKKAKRVKRSVCQALSISLGTLYSIYLFSYFGSLIEAESVSGSIATAVVTPHMLCCVLAVIFGWIGFLGNRQGFALAAAILYCAAAVLFIMYAALVVPMIIFGFIGYAMIGRIKKANE